MRRRYDAESGLARLLARCDPGSLFERFTETARQVVVCAQQEARDLGHKFIGTEHELLGLLRVSEGPVADALGSLTITAESAREQVVRIVGSNEGLTGGHMPFTPRAKKVLERALREALSLGHTHIGPEHLLLGLLAQNDGVSNRILVESGADPESIRSRLLPLLPGPDPTTAQPPRGRTMAGRAADAGHAERSVSFRITPTVDAHHFLMVAAARAVADGRTEFTINDLLVTLTRSDETAQLLEELGINEETMREAIKKHRT